MTEYIFERETVSDGVYAYEKREPIVRCRDCFYYDDTEKHESSERWWCEKLFYFMEPREYCSRARQRA